MMFTEIAEREGIDGNKLKKRVERGSVVLLKNSVRDIGPG